MFMLPVVERGEWCEIEDCGESRIIPAEYAEYTDTIVWSGPGYCARLSAPGYLDCTDWIGPFNTAAEAAEALAREYFYAEDEDEIWRAFLISNGVSASALAWFFGPEIRA